MIQALRKACAAEEFDHELLSSYLQDYKAPHRKITTLLRSGDIIRVKKGLYVFGEAWRRAPIHRGVLANLIYGPSYVSMEWALSYYGLIPERVEAVTSMTPSRKKRFDTPVGCFTYTYINTRRFTVGVDWVSIDKQRHFLLASPEKALIDTVQRYRNIRNATEMVDHLIENLRIDEDLLMDLNLGRIQKIAAAYRHPTINLLYTTLNLGF